MQYYLSFVIDSIPFAVAIDEVQEIARPKGSSITKATDARNLVGVFNLRGTPIPLYDLPGHLSLERGTRYEVIVIHQGNVTIGIVVDKVLGIVSARDIIPYPDCVPRKSFLLGVVPQTEPLVQVISLDRLFTRQRIMAIQKFMEQQTA